MRRLLEHLFNILFPIPEAEKRVLGMDRPRFKTARHPPDEFVHALLDYRQDEVRRLVWLIKYRGNRKAVRKAARMMYEDLLAHLADEYMFAQESARLLVPIPLSSQRRKKRGFNQCALLAKAVTSCDHTDSVIYAPVLEKIHQTDSQTEQPSKRARQKNVQGCFAVAQPQAVFDRDIILLDDVVTTGATLREARHTLREADARSVRAITLAH